jgi:hypothetical protein
VDGLRFDTLIRLVQEASTRRGALTAALAAGAASAVAGAGLVLSGSEAEAKKKKKKKKKCPVCAPLLSGAPCQTNLQCCTNETNRLCAIASTATTNTRTCCGGVGATCATTADCCLDFTCSGGVCNS